MRKVVIFDLDDTLYPEREYAFSGFSATAEAFADVLGDPVRTLADLKRLFDSPHRSRTFDALLVERGLHDAADLAARMVRAYRNHRPTIRLFADADAALSRLRSSCKLGVLTDGRPTAQWAKIDALGIRSRVNEVIVTSELAPVSTKRGDETTTAAPDHSKPHPLAFEEIARRLGAATADCCYVGDNPAKDFVAPNALGWLTVQVRRHEGLYADVAPAAGGEPRQVIENLAELDALLR